MTWVTIQVNFEINFLRNDMKCLDYVGNNWRFYDDESAYAEMLSLSLYSRLPFTSFSKP